MQHLDLCKLCRSKVAAQGVIEATQAADPLSTHVSRKQSCHLTLHAFLWLFLNFVLFLNFCTEYILQTTCFTFRGGGGGGEGLIRSVKYILYHDYCLFTAVRFMIIILLLLIIIIVTEVVEAWMPLVSWSHSWPLKELFFLRSVPAFALLLIHLPWGKGP